METQSKKRSNAIGEGWRVSKSRSGLSKDHRGFEVCYKNSSGNYEPTFTVPIDIARECAEQYVQGRFFLTRDGINASAAKYIARKLQSAGISIDGFSERSKLPTNEETQADKSSTNETLESEPGESRRSTSTSRSPVYFPTISARTPSSLKEENRQNLAFILSGVSPDSPENKTATGQMRTLREIAESPSSRISSSASLLLDHWYVLKNLHSLSAEHFQSAWENARNAPSGQAGTDLLKLQSRFEKFQLDEVGSQLLEPSLSPFFADIEAGSILLLYRFFRRARRKIESIHSEAPVVASERKPSFLSKLLSRRGGKGGNAEGERAVVETDVLEQVEAYVQQAVKLGRILRSPLLDKARHA